MFPLKGSVKVDSAFLRLGELVCVAAAHSMPNNEVHACLNVKAQMRMFFLVLPEQYTTKHAGNFSSMFDRQG